MKEPITNKSQMYQKLLSGAFGNVCKSWSNVQDFLAAGPHPAGSVFAVRTLIRNGTFFSPQPADKVVETCSRLMCGYNIVINLPDHKLVIQGEVCRNPDLRLYYSTVTKSMRAALLEDGKSVRGLTAKMILEHYLDASSYEDLMVLLEQYPDHVVEFSVHRVPVGVDRRRRCIFWEVRRY